MCGAVWQVSVARRKHVVGGRAAMQANTHTSTHTLPARNQQPGAERRARGKGHGVVMADLRSIGGGSVPQAYPRFCVRRTAQQACHLLAGLPARADFRVGSDTAWRCNYELYVQGRWCTWHDRRLRKLTDPARSGPNGPVASTIGWARARHCVLL